MEKDYNQLLGRVVARSGNTSEEGTKKEGGTIALVGLASLHLGRVGLPLTPFGSPKTEGFGRISSPVLIRNEIPSLWSRIDYIGIHLLSYLK